MLIYRPKNIKFCKFESSMGPAHPQPPINQSNSDWNLIQKSSPMNSSHAKTLTNRISSSSVAPNPTYESLANRRQSSRLNPPQPLTTTNASQPDDYSHPPPQPPQQDSLMDITSIDSTTHDPEPSPDHPQSSSVLAHLAAVLENVRAFPVPTAIETADTIALLVALLVSQSPSPPSSVAIPAEPSIKSVAAELAELKSLVSGLAGKLTAPSTPNVLSFATVISQQGGWNPKRPPP